MNDLEGVFGDLFFGVGVITMCGKVHSGGFIEEVLDI
jgi:hypothetical protein